MVKSKPYHDPFMKRIREILLDASAQTSKGTIRNLVFSEVQSYSREVQEAEKTSDLFLKLCELFVDCESITIPDQSFKVMVAKLLHECSFSKAPTNEELQELAGMDATSIEAAMAYFKDKDCLVSTQGKSGDRKRSMKRDPMPAAELETK